jgi:hypothetical protein
MRFYMSVSQLVEMVGTALLTVERELRYLDSKEVRREEPRFQRFRDKQSNLNSNLGKSFFVHVRILVSGIANLLGNRWRWPSMCSQTSPIPR